ncbi:VanZ family protein [Flavobacterium alvei]|uniref:VanZ family protein n=1 Tax=Flavobacterium alvei TaxID=2080416 RepID=UPI0013FE4B4E|nr:VanZ family protein [Flavobacterium alvei]
MRRTIFLYSAIFWTGIILFLSLENANEIKQIEIPNFDKLIHAVFHFVFTTLWFLYLKKKLVTITNFPLLSFALMGSFFFGIAIELMQQYFTTTRSADVLDVLANLFGASLAVISIILLNNYNRFIDKI